MMRVILLLPISTVIVLGLSTWTLPAPPPAQADAHRAQTLLRHAINPEAPIESRIGETPASVLEMFKDAGLGTPTTHELTPAERRAFADAVAKLPLLHARILRERLRRVSFLDGMPNTALTSTVNPDETHHVFDITIRASVFAETVSEFLTQKERTCFDTTGSPLAVSIETGPLDAVVYVLLHEATHIVDRSLGFTPEFGARASDGSAMTPFTEGVWSERTIPVPRFRHEILGRVRFGAGGEPLPIDQAISVYEALMKTPFASLYGSTNWYDDAAELVTWYHLAERLALPYRVVIRDAGREVFAYEPMRSPLVRSRIDQMARFYEAG